MKKLISVMFVLLVIVAGGAFLLLGNLDSIAKRVIERAGTETMGSAVRVGSVSIDLRGGTATINNLRVANPRGFSNQDMLRFEQLHADIDIRSLNSDIIRINRITTTEPYVLYELEGNRANLDVVRERLARPTADTPPDPDSEIVMSIGEIRVDNISGRLQADRLPRPVDVNLGSVHLENMEGTPGIIALQIARPLISQVYRNATVALVTVTTDLLEGGLSDRGERALRELSDEASERVRDVGSSVEDAVEDLTDRVRNIFRNN